MSPQGGAGCEWRDDIDDEAGFFVRLEAIDGHES